MNVAILEMTESSSLKITDIDFVITVAINIINEKGIKVNWTVNIMRIGGSVKGVAYFVIRIREKVKDLVHEGRVKVDILVF